MILFGLIGFPLGHSFSADYHNNKFKSASGDRKEYRLFPLENIEGFPQLLRSYPELSGLNVTIPHKEAIIPYLDALDDVAQSTGAVNVITITREGGNIRTKGFNTDCPGFLQTLSNQVPPGPALILGTGGAAKAVSFALQEINVPFSFVSRRNKGHNIIAYEDLTIDLIESHLLIINATPLGMFPNTGNFPPIPYQYLSEEHYLYDLIYNPGETEFLKRGKAMNAQTMSGMQMFLNQAELSSRFFLANI